MSSFKVEFYKELLCPHHLESTVDILLNLLSHNCLPPSWLFRKIAVHSPVSCVSSFPSPLKTPGVLVTPGTVRVSAPGLLGQGTQRTAVLAHPLEAPESKGWFFTAPEGASGPGLNQLMAPWACLHPSGGCL